MSVLTKIVLQILRRRGPDGLQNFYFVRGRGIRAVARRPRAMTLPDLRQAMERLIAAGQEKEVCRLGNYGLQRFGADAILTRRDAIWALVVEGRDPGTIRRKLEETRPMGPLEEGEEYLHRFPDGPMEPKALAAAIAELEKEGNPQAAAWLRKLAW